MASEAAYYFTQMVSPHLFGHEPQDNNYLAEIVERVGNPEYQLLDCPPQSLHNEN